MHFKYNFGRYRVSFNLLRYFSGNLHGIRSSFCFSEMTDPKPEPKRRPKLVHISSVLFSIISIIQGIFLCIYPCEYLGSCWIIVFLLFFITASVLSLGLRFQKNLRSRFESIPKLDIKSWLWFVWFVYSIGLMVSITVIFRGVIEGNHEETCVNKNGNFAGIFNDVGVCRTKDNETFVKEGTICGSLHNGTEYSKKFCWKTIGLLPTDVFLGPNVLKVVLCLTPVLMLLLLKAARAPKRKESPDGAVHLTDAECQEPEDPIEDEDLKNLYFRATLNLFDGMEMLEELLEHGKHGVDVPRRLEEAILVCVCLFYIFSFLELLHLAFRCKDEENNAPDTTTTDVDKEEERRKTKWRWAHFVNTIFQLTLNFSFLILRAIMWLKYKRDAAIFIAKNVISIVMNVMPFLIAWDVVDNKSDEN